MHKKIFRRQKTSKGFTIIELMIVVAIIGIVSLIGLRLYLGQQEKAKEAIIKGNASTVQTLVQSELSDNSLSMEDINSSFLNQIVLSASVHNPFNNMLQIISYYSTPDKPSETIPGMVYIWKDSSQVFHINGWKNIEGDDVFPTDLTARK